MIFLLLFISYFVKYFLCPSHFNQNNHKKDSEVKIHSDNIDVVDFFFTDKKMRTCLKDPAHDELCTVCSVGTFFVAHYTGSFFP